ncbi:MAG: hypothetical protein HQK54_14805, partial [Oligoflexales bacterium]|nr:hypothetical protein [Oligoflexales bacterium]
MRYLIIYLFLITGVMTGCGKKEADALSRQELLDRLKVFGTVANPLVSKLAKQEGESTVPITVHIAVPGNSEATIEPFKPSAENPMEVVLEASDITVDPSSFKYDQYTGFRHLQAGITAKVPLESRFPSGRGGDAKFGLRIKSGGSEFLMTSLFAVRPEGSSDLTLASPTIDSITPAEGASVGSGNVKISMTATAAASTSNQSAAGTKTTASPSTAPAASDTPPAPANLLEDPPPANPPTTQPTNERGRNSGERSLSYNWFVTG